MSNLGTVSRHSFSHHRALNAMKASSQKTCAVLYADLNSGNFSASQTASIAAHALNHANAEAQHNMERGMKRVVRAIEGFGGSLIRQAGSEVVAAFPSADDAFHAACEMRWRVASLPPVLGSQLQVRIGINHGAVTVTGTHISGEGADMAASLVALAGDGQLLVSGRAADELASHLQSVLVPVKSAESNTMGLSVYIAQFDASTLAELTKRPVPVVAKAQKRLLLTYCGKEFWLESKSESIRLGRDPANDIVIADRRASRLHATIHRRGEFFILHDVSTNGTYVALNGTEQLVKQNELVLSNQGSIIFARGGNEPSEAIRFEIKE